MTSLYNAGRAVASAVLFFLCLSAVAGCARREADTPRQAVSAQEQELRRQKTGE